VTVRQVDALPLGPSPNGGELAGAPDEATGDPTGVVAVGHLVTGGDDVVEAHRFSEGGHHVLGSRGGEHQLAPRPAVLRQDVERKGGDEGTQLPHCQFSGLSDLSLGPALGDARRPRARAIDTRFSPKRS